MTTQSQSPSTEGGSKPRTYVLLHHHRHGVSPFVIESELCLSDLDAEDVAQNLGIDYESERDDESVEIVEATVQRFVRHD